MTANRKNDHRYATSSLRRLVTLAALAALAALLLPLGAAFAQDGSDSEAARYQAALAVFGEGAWLIESVVSPAGATAFPQDGSAYLQLTPQVTLAGTAGCNRFIASFTLSDAGSVAFGPVIATRMACPEPAMSREFAVFEAFENVSQHRLDGEHLILAGGGFELRLAPGASDGSTAVGAGDAVKLGRSSALYLDAFNAALREAAAAGAPWPSDPIRVALAYVDLLGAPNALITRADVFEPGAETASRTLVTIVEDGLLDDSVAGLEQLVTLQLRDGVWHVSAYQGTWLCRRPPGASVAMPGVCD